MFREEHAAKQNPNAAGKRQGGTVIDIRLERPRAESGHAFTSYPRNPWTGIHAGREFLYDFRHPILFGRRVIAGLRGQIPQVGRQQRILSVGLMTVGGLNVLVGAAMLVRGAGWI
jgi:hypothetical protein